MINQDFVFPQDNLNQNITDKFQRAGGLAMRDYFAAQVSSAALALAKGTTIDDAFQNAAEMAYKFADQMMVARQKVKGAEGEVA